MMKKKIEKKKLNLIKCFKKIKTNYFCYLVFCISYCISHLNSMYCKQSLALCSCHVYRLIGEVRHLHNAEIGKAFAFFSNLFVDHKISNFAPLHFC